MSRTCSIAGCERVHVARGWCKKHWRAWRAHGDPLHEPPTLAERFWAKVDKTSTCWNWTASLDDSGYGRIFVNGRPLTAHRVALTLSGTEIPEGMHVDHKCWNRKCVNPDHLRVVSSSGNQQNLQGPRSHNRSGFLGVYEDKRRGTWSSEVRLHGEKHWCGSYSTPEEAAEAARAKRLELFIYNDHDRKELAS